MDGVRRVRRRCQRQKQLPRCSLPSRVQTQKQYESQSDRVVFICMIGARRTRRDHAIRGFSSFVASVQCLSDVYVLAKRWVLGLCDWQRIPPPWARIGIQLGRRSSQKQIWSRSVVHVDLRVKVNKFWKLWHVLSAIYDDLRDCDRAEYQSCLIAKPHISSNISWAVMSIMYLLPTTTFPLCKRLPPNRLPLLLLLLYPSC